MTTTATSRPGRDPLARLVARAGEGVSGAGLAAFRALFGAVMLAATIRFAAKGWVHSLYIEPDFHFTYPGFGWVAPWPGAGMYIHFAVMGAAALLLLVGLYTRASALLFFLTFTYVELLDKATYLNHYYFVSLMALLLVFVPAGARCSVDAWRRSGRGAAPVGRWAYWLLRAQVGVVYFYAGFAKLNGDWLLRAEPLATWLQVHTDVAVIGPLLGQAWVAYAMSWAGAAFDLTIAGFLTWRRTRAAAYAVAVAFHVSVWSLFPIGVFSWVMLVSATVFFEPSWPQAALARVRRQPRPSPSVDPRPRASLPAWGAALAGVYLLVQVLAPLRFALYPGPVNWTEEGFRFSWRVMLVEKTGLVELRVVTDASARPIRVYPRRALSPLQYRMLCTQPDMIQQYARHVAAQYRRAGHQDVRVYADAWVSWNGRPSARIADPAADLAAASTGLAASPWILPPATNGGP